MAQTRVIAAGGKIFLNSFNETPHITADTAHMLIPERGDGQQF